MQQTTLTIYAVPVPPTNQGCVTRYIEYDISRAPKATVMQNMRASAVIVHIRSASLCLFSLGRGGTRHVAKARLMAWASMAPLCSHHAFMHAFIHSSIHASVHPCMHPFFHLLKQASSAKLAVDLAHDTGAKYAKCKQMLCERGGRLLDANKLDWC